MGDKGGRKNKARNQKQNKQKQKQQSKLEKQPKVVADLDTNRKPT